MKIWPEGKKELPTTESIIWDNCTVNLYSTPVQFTAFTNVLTTNSNLT